jgi:Asp-tRNA(Asn)/Glu-tRNA(Gln) amidotransferase A subunit family amidase
VQDTTDLFLTTSITVIADLLATGALTPKMLRDEVLLAAAAYEGSVHAWVVLDPDELLHERAGDIARPFGYQVRGLRGIPFGAKDIFNTKGFPTERGSVAWRGYTPGNNSRVIDSLQGNGAVLIGKTVTAELAVDEESATCNPHDCRYSPGTSSGGSAVACATGMVPFALASQSGASIARPASFTGVFGYKPSLGLVPRTGVLKTADTLDTVGFLAARAENIRPVLEGMRVRGPDFPFVYAHVDSSPAHAEPKGGRWQIGVLRTPWWQGATEPVRTGFDRGLQRVAALATVELVDMPWPSILDEVHELHDLMYCKSLAYYFSEEYESHQNAFSEVLADRMERGRGVTGQQYMTAVKRQDEISRAIGAELVDYDAVVTLSTSQTAPLRGILPNADPSLIWTFTGIPAATYPLELGSDGLPVGAQLIGRRWDDLRVISVLEMLAATEAIPDRSLPIA